MTPITQILRFPARFVLAAKGRKPWKSALITNTAWPRRLNMCAKDRFAQEKLFVVVLSNRPLDGLAGLLGIAAGFGILTAG